MLDVVALGELLIDFTYESVDEKGYPTMVPIPAARRQTFWRPWLNSAVKRL